MAFSAMPVILAAHSVIGKKGGSGKMISWWALILWFLFGYFVWLGCMVMVIKYGQAVDKERQKERQMSGERLRVDCAGRQYTLIQYHDGSVHALRYGEPWRNLVGDGLVLALGYDLDEARAIIKRQGEEITLLKKQIEDREDLIDKGISLYKRWEDYAQSLIDKITSKESEK